MENKANRGLGCQSFCLELAHMYVVRNFCGEEEELHLTICVLIFKHHKNEEFIQNHVEAQGLRRPFNLKYVPLGIFVGE